MHYNLGSANGSHDNIRYWEFWNEPDSFSGAARRSSFIHYTKRQPGR